MLHNTVPPFQKFPVLVQASEEGLAVAAAGGATSAGAEAGAGGGHLMSVAMQAHFDKQRAEVGSRLFVGNLPTTVDHALLLPVLSFYGPLVSLRLGQESSQRYAFAVFEYTSSAEAARSALSGFPLVGPRATGAGAGAGAGAAKESRLVTAPEDERTEAADLALILQAAAEKMGT